MRLQLDSSTTRSGDTSQTAAASGFASGVNKGLAGLPGSSDSIQISSASSALNRIASDRAAKVNQLTAAVQNGSYQVSSSLISRAIVEYGVS
jgi:flagellar biosynthesis anti-sigma factor FlgM